MSEPKTERSFRLFGQLKFIRGDGADDDDGVDVALTEDDVARLDMTRTR